MNFKRYIKTLFKLHLPNYISFVFLFTLTLSCAIGQVFDDRKIISNPPNSFVQKVTLDLDNDGDLDIAATFYEVNKAILKLFENKGKGLFEPVLLVGEIANSFSELGTLDIDGDGFEEIIDLGVNCSYKYIDGNFVRSKLPFKDKYIISIQSANIDNDGDLDFLCLSLNGNFIWYEKLQNGNWTDSMINEKSVSIKDFKVGDINGDGLDEIVCLHSYRVMGSGGGEITFHDEYNLVLMQNDGSNHFITKEIFP